MVLLLAAAPRAYSQPAPHDDESALPPQPSYQRSAVQPVQPAVPAEPELPAFSRSSWFLGFGANVGTLSGQDVVADTFVGSGFDLLFGGMISKRFAVVVEISPMFFQDPSDSDADVVQTSFVAGAQFLPSDSIWIRVGFGSTTLDFQYNGDTVGEVDKGSSLVIAAGVEVYRQTSFVIDIHGRLIGTSFDQFDSGTTVASFGIGFSWY